MKLNVAGYVLAYIVIGCIQIYGNMISKYIFLNLVYFSDFKTAKVKIRISNNCKLTSILSYRFWLADHKSVPNFEMRQVEG